MALKGVKVIEIMGLGPGPLCGSVFADYGARVIVVQKIKPSRFDVTSNGKKMLSLNLKTKHGANVFRKLCATSDVLLDTFRPGVMENLGLGPDLLLKDNSKLIYARLTEFGKTGYYNAKAGHDINYVAMSGILLAFSKNIEAPTLPMTVLTDFVGGSLICVIGILMALFERYKSGKGQIIDCSLTAGLAYLSNLPIWSGKPEKNTYKTKDGKLMAVGALEPEFNSNFLKTLELAENEYSQLNGELMKKFEKIFLTKTQEEWSQIFVNADACVAPILDLESKDKYEYYSKTKSFYGDANEMVVPEVAPNLSRTPGESSRRKQKPKAGQHSVEILKELGYKNKDIKELLKMGHVYAPPKSHL